MSKKLKGRGVDLLFYVNPQLREDDKQKFKELISKGVEIDDAGIGKGVSFQ